MGRGGKQRQADLRVKAPFRVRLHKGQKRVVDSLDVAKSRGSLFPVLSLKRKRALHVLDICLRRERRGVRFANV
jgi:hypothetical protein